MRTWRLSHTLPGGDVSLWTQTQGTPGLRLFITRSKIDGLTRATLARGNGVRKAVEHIPWDELEAIRAKFIALSAMLGPNFQGDQREIDLDV